MDEILQQALGYLRGMWHRRWFGLAAAWLAAIIGVVVVYRIPEKYEASARVYVDTESLLGPMLSGLAIRPNVDQQVALMSRTLISRPNVEKLVRMADLDLGYTPGPAREELVDNVMRTIGLGGSSATNLYIISYRDPKPEQARRVVQSLLAIFVESSLGDKRQDSRTAVRFIDQQIKRYEDSLQAAETRLKEWKLKNMGVAGRDGQDYFGRLAGIRNAIESARLELDAAEQSRDAYKKELAGETPTFLAEPADPSLQDALPEIDGRISSLRKAQDELLLRYTDVHPDVVANKRLIEQLEEQRKTELAARRKANAAAGRPSGPAAERNPMFQQLRLSLAEAEANVASLRSRLAGYENQFRQLKGQAAMVPEVEEEYTQLNRDYEVKKRTYESLLNRREQGSMGIELQDAGGAVFRVIDPPRVSPQPVAPNRLALLGLAFLASIGAGLFASLVASQTMPTVQDAQTLRVTTNRPILGMVSMLPTEALRRLRRRSTIFFASGLGALIAAFGGVLAFALLIGRAA
jgi:polysaccharide chain length determinant protein (PEP-CTERM system associated)